MGNENVNPEAEKESVSEENIRNFFLHSQTLTEMNTRYSCWGINVPVHRADKLGIFM
jgi:hypothetical protein